MQEVLDGLEAASSMRTDRSHFLTHDVGVESRIEHPRGGDGWHLVDGVVGQLHRL